MDTIYARLILLLALVAAPACAQRAHRIDVMPSPSGVPGSIRFYELLSNCGTPNDLSTCQYAEIQTEAALAGNKQYKFGANLETAGALYFLSGISAPQINADALGSVLTIRGSSTGSGNINLQPGNVAGNSSVVFQSARLDAPVFITKDALGTTTSDAWQAQKDDGTIFARLLGGTNASLPGAFLAGGFFCQTANSCQQGSSGNRFTKIWTTDIDISGSCTGAGCPSAGFPVSDAVWLVEDNADGSKEMRFELGGLTTATQRALTVQDANYTLAGTNLAQTFTSVQSFTDTISALDGIKFFEATSGSNTTTLKAPSMSASYTYLLGRDFLPPADDFSKLGNDANWWLSARIIQLEPGSDNTGSLGTTTRAYNSTVFYFGTVKSSLVGSTDGVFLGGIGGRFQGSFTTAIAQTGFEPEQNGTAYVGTTSKRFDNVVTEKLDIDTSITVGANTGLTVTLDCGSGTALKRLYTRFGVVYDTTCGIP